MTTTNHHNNNHPKNGATAPTETELWDTLNGDERPVNQGNPKVIDHSTTQVADPELEEELFLDEEDPDLYRTKVSFAASPIARLGLASGGVFIGIVVIGNIVSGLKSNQSNPTPESPSTPITASATPSPSPSSTQSDSDLKAQIAFKSQHDLLQSQAVPQAVPKPPAPAVQPSPPPAAPAAVVAPPPPSISPPESFPPESVTPPPKPTPPPIQVVATPPPSLPTDPNKVWESLSESATYGSLPTVSYTPPPPPPVIAASTTSPKTPPASSDMTGIPSLGSYHSTTVSSRRKLRIGTQAKAILLNPIAWSADGKDVAFNGTAAPKFIARLEQSLNDSDGNEVIPQGAELVVAVRSLDTRSGMAELTALQIIIDNQEFAPPIGAITIRGAHGNPLIADKFQDKGKEIAAADRAMFLFGALSKVGELMNRSDSQVLVTAGGSTSASTTSGKTNLLGGVLQGGFGALAQQQQQRNQQWLQEIMQRPDIRYIPAGKELTIFINQTMTL